MLGSNSLVLDEADGTNPQENPEICVKHFRRQHHPQYNTYIHLTQKSNSEL